MRLLFLTRKFPPSVGGMEKLSAELAQALQQQAPTTVIAWGRSQLGLPLFLPVAFMRAAWAIRMRGVSHVHLGDALLAPLGLALKRLFGVRVSATACGLDVTYRPAWYQAVVPPALARLDHVVAISEATREACLARGVAPERLSVIPPGIESAAYAQAADAAALARIAGRALAGQRVLLTVGRLVRRKGVAWFVDAVMPRLPADVVYLVAGEGPERPRIEAAIAAHGLGDRVRLLGRVSDDDVHTLYAGAHVFVMPNVPVPGDMEGFGIVAIEAASAGLPVVASDLEGIRAALADPATGRLVAAENPLAFVGALDAALAATPAEREAAQRAVREHFGWPSAARRYLDHIGGTPHA